VSATAPAAARLSNPFPGLRPFLEEEQHLFFGRESQVDTMIDKLSATRFLAVVGTSGSGKSSLVNCGLKPALRRGLMASAGTSWRMAHFRPGSDPIRAMAQALVKPDGLFRNADIEGMSVQEIVEATLRMSKLGLVDAYEQAVFDQSPNLLVIVDQFEELFRYRNLQPSAGGGQGTDEKAIAFVNLLLEAASSPHPIYVVITMRSDFLGDCAQFEGLPEAINRGQYLVPRMSRDERRSAIAGPAAVAGGEISPILLTRLVNDVGDNPDQLSILQHALNRTWAEWQRQGETGAVDLPHYEAVGTMTHALDYHAEKAYGELQGDQQKRICEKVFQAITDKGTDARGIRRPTSASTLCAITGASVAELTSVLAAFRKPSRSFVMPPVSDTIAPETVIDISHESLMRVWNRLKAWVDDEAESASQYQRLAQNASLHAKGAAGLMTDPELSLTLDWQQKRQPNAAWGERYRPGFDSAIAFLEESRKARDAAVEAEKERQRRELRRTRIVAVVLGAAFLFAIGFGGYAIYQQRRASTERAAREHADTLASAQHKLAEEQERGRKQAEELNQKLAVALNEAESAKKEADDANARAQHEKEVAETMAHKFLEASTEARLAENWQIEKMEQLQQDQDAHKDAATIKRDQEELDASATKSKELKLDAAAKAADAAAFAAGAHLISPSQISDSDLFQNAEVTGCTGCTKNSLGKVRGLPDTQCNEVQLFTRNPNDMFRGSNGSACRATVFEDGQQVGFEHSIEWKTKTPVTVKSVGLFAAHDWVRYRRSFETFKLYVRKQGKWYQVAKYSPALMYGGSCGPQSCFPPPVIKYLPGTVLAACLNVPATTGQEFRAVFVQSVSSVERFSGPRVLQLDGYAAPDCSK
jgi:Novel STAND NTPase 1